MVGTEGRKLPTETCCACATSTPQTDVAVTTANTGHTHRDAGRAAA
jgi:hypothetical protein